jgi:hypothetical protein
MSVTINPATPPDTGESPGLGASQMRGIKQAILDLFGLPSNTAINAPIMSFPAVAPSAAAAANRAALQAAIDALPATGGRIVLPQYGIHIDDAINVTKPLVVQGPGLTEVSTPGTFGLYQDTASKTIWNVTGKGGVVLRDLSHFLTTNALGVVVDGPTGSLKGTELMLLDNCQFYGGAIAFDVRNGIFYGARRSQFWNQTEFGIKVNNTLDPDQGDGFVEGCIFSEPAGANGFYWLRGGGVRFINNKVLGDDYGMQFDVLANPATSDIIIMGNSFENETLGGILFTRSSGAMSLEHVQIVGNQFSPAATNAHNAIVVQPVGAGLLIQRLIIASNVIHRCDKCLVLREVNGGLIHGNDFDCGTAVFDLASTVLNLDVGENYYGSSPAILTGTPGATCTMRGGNLGGSPGIPVASLPAFGSGSQAFASDGKNPGDGGYAFGVVAAGGSGTPTYRAGGNWLA